MASRKLAALVVAASLVVGVAGASLAATTVPQAVYTEQGATRPQDAISQSLLKAGVKDVPVQHWAAGSISRLLDAGLLTPDADGNLKADAAITAEGGVAVFAKVLGIASKTDSAEVAAKKAADAGLISVEPGKSLTRYQVAEMLFKALGLQKADTSLLPFSDVAPEQKAVLAALYNAGVFKGYPDGTFQPDGTLTASEVAILIDRIMGASK